MAVRVSTLIFSHHIDIFSGQKSKRSLSTHIACHLIAMAAIPERSRDILPRDDSTTGGTAATATMSPIQCTANFVGITQFEIADEIRICLDSGKTIEAHYCQRSRLPMLCMLNDPDAKSFWTTTYDFATNDARTYPTLLLESNTNLSAAQKEVLLWHHKLSHASTGWIQLLMGDKKWMTDLVDEVNTGPFLPCRYKGPTCNIDGLKCAACLCAKAQ